MSVVYPQHQLPGSETFLSKAQRSELLLTARREDADRRGRSEERRRERKLKLRENKKEKPKMLPVLLTSLRKPGPRAGPKCCPLAPKCCTCKCGDI